MRGTTDLEAELAAIGQRNNMRSLGLLERYGPKPVEPECSTSLNDSEQMARDLDVKDWDAVDTDNWRPEGEDGDDWKPKDAPVQEVKAAAPAVARPVGLSTLSKMDIFGSSLDMSGLFTKGATSAAPVKQQLASETMTATLTEALLRQHTREINEQQMFQSSIAQWREDVQKHGVLSTAPIQPVILGDAGQRWNLQRWNRKMAGLHGEEQVAEDEAERAAQGRVLFRPVQGAAALPSGRPGRAIFASARRAISIRRELSMRSHAHGRVRPQTVRVQAPLKITTAIPLDPMAQTRAQKEEAARETEKLAREAARRAARRAAARAAAINAAKQAEDDAARMVREQEQAAAEDDAQRVAQVARRAAVAREAAQAARRKRQPMFNVPTPEPGKEPTRTSMLPKKVSSSGTSESGRSTSASSRPASQRTNTQSPRTQRSATPAYSEKGSTRSSPGAIQARRKRPQSASRLGQSQSQRGATTASPLGKAVAPSITGAVVSATPPLAPPSQPSQPSTQLTPGMAAAAAAAKAKSAAAVSTGASGENTPTGGAPYPPPLILNGGAPAQIPLPPAPTAATGSQNMPPVLTAAAHAVISSSAPSPATVSAGSKAGHGKTPLAESVLQPAQAVYVPAQRLSIGEANKAGGRKPPGGLSSPILTRPVSASVQA